MVAGLIGLKGDGDDVSNTEQPVAQAWQYGYERFFSESAAGLADARLIPLASPVLSVPPVAATESYAISGDERRGEPDVSDERIVEDFFQGYREGGGTDEERIDAMIFCESSWIIDPPGYHLGLAQFDSETWATVSVITGFIDPLNPFHQGYNVAAWASMVSPGTSAGWPRCWWVW